MKTLWVDITDLVGWKGTLTGIQRVCAEVSLGLKRELSGRVVFVYYDQYLGRFQEAQGIDVTHEGADLSGAGFLQRLLLRTDRPTKGLKHFGLRYLPSTDSIPMQTGDVFFTPANNSGFRGYMHELNRLKQAHKLSVIQVVHDVLPITTPHFFEDELVRKHYSYFARLIASADHIVTVSQHTKDELEREFSRQIEEAKPKITVINPGSSIGNSHEKKPSDPKLADEFILSWSTIEPRKNRELLYNTVNYAINKKIDIPQIVIAGKEGWLSHDFVSIAQRNTAIADKFRVILAPSDDELAWLINNCLFSVYPSHAEGWGLPIAESLHFGKPCITLDASSMPEVAGDAVDYIKNPFDVAEMLKAIQTMLEPEYHKLAVKRAKNFKPISWDDSVNRYKDLILKYLDLEK